MERLSTEYLLKDEEVESLVSYLRENNFDVRQVSDKTSVNFGSYHIFTREGKTLIHNGDLHNRRKLSIFYKAESLDKIVRAYIEIKKV